MSDEGLSEKQLERVRRGGRPAVYLISALISLCVGIGFIAMALEDVRRPWPVNEAHLLVGLIAGAVGIVGGVIQVFMWRRYRAQYKEFRKLSCPGCGYDRRGLAADAKCPECGTVPS